MTTYAFSALANGQHLAFDPTVDVLAFDDDAISAAAVHIVQQGANLSFSFGGKTVWLDGTDLTRLGLDTVSFADGSLLVIGGGGYDAFGDAYGQQYTLADSTVGNQVQGLWGADLVSTGSGADRIVGNVALTPIQHVSRDGATGSPTGSAHASISADGRYVAFDGDWSNFGTVGNGDGVIVKDLVTGSFSNEHRNAGGTVGNSGAGSTVISAEGNVVVFLSASSNLVDGPSSGALYDIYASDPNGAEIVRVSTGSGGTLAADGRSLNPDISGAGQFVVFESTTSNFAAGGSTAQTDIFVKDLLSDQTVRVSTSLSGGDGNGESINARVSADGDYVVFQSTATNLSTGDTNGYSDIFLWEAATGTLTNLTEDLAAVSNPNNGSFRPDVAYNGDANAIVVFQTARNLVEADQSNGTDIYALNFKTGEITLVSSKADGSGVALSSEDASVSDDGRWVVFTSYSDDLVDGDSNGSRDIFVKDLYTGAIALVSKSAAGAAGNGASTNARISSGGDWIVFESSATNLAGTDANGGFGDIFRVANPLLQDTLVGGAGNDSYVVQRQDVIVEEAGGGTDTVESSITWTLGANLENLTLTGAANLAGTGNALANVITGNAGNNVLNGAGGIDTASYANATGAVTVSLAVTTTQATGFGNDRLLGFENLTGSRFDDRLTGNDGNNVLDGGLGNDSMEGGLGNDTYVVNAAGDIVSGEVAGGGTDTVRSSVTWTLQPTLENLTLIGNAAINGSGNAAANAITGNGAANTLNGASGNDTLGGGAGNDRLIGGNGNDRLDGGAGNDTMEGGNGSDTYVCDSSADIVSEAGTTDGDIDSVIASVNWTLGAMLENLTLTGSATTGNGNAAANMLTGNAAANTMNGAAGNDTISGGGGNDTLTGAAGNDQLTGGAGADDFVLASAVGSDTITDFLTGTDDIAVRRAVFGIGDGDLLLEGARTRAGPGNFDTAAELVIFTANQGALTADAAATAIGSANAAYAVGDDRLFVIDNGTSSAVFLFTASDANAQVSAAELTLLATLTGTASTAVADYLLVA